MILNNLRGKNITIKFDELTQLVSMDKSLSNDIYFYLRSYFGGKKFTDDDLLFYNGEYPIIEYNGIEVSRSRYNFIGISNILDIDEALVHKKDTILMKYNKFYLENLDLQIEIDELERQFLKIVDKLRDSIPSEDIISIPDIALNAEVLLSKNIFSYVSMENSYYDKLLQIVRILMFGQDKLGCDYLLYLHNVDTYLNDKELKCIIQMCECVSNIKLVVSFCDTRYMSIDMVEYVNFLFENDVSYLPSLDVMLDKLNKYNLSLRYFSMEDIKKFIYINAKYLISGDYGGSMYDLDMYNTVVSRVKYEDRGVENIENCIII